MKINQTFINTSILATLSVLACTAVYAEDTRAFNYLPPSVTTTQPISSAKLDPNSADGGFYITTPGYYYLSTDISYNPSMGTDSLPAIQIDTDNVILDLGTKNIAYRAGAAGLLSTAILVTAGKKNITIKNGSISGFASGTAAGIVNLAGNNSNILLEDLIINKNTAGIPLLVTDAGAATPSVGIQLRGVQILNNANTAALNGASLNNIKNLTITNCVFSSNTTTTGNATGLLLSGCSDIIMDNVDASNNSTTAAAASAYGIRFASSTKNARARNCRMVANNTTGGTGAASAYGLSLNASSANYFEDCLFSSQSSIAKAYGVAIEAASNSNYFKNCVADENAVTVATAAYNAYGFYLSSSNSNRFIGCQANGNNNSTGGATTENYSAYGFYSTGGVANNFFECTASRNSSGGFHDSYVATSYSAGFTLNSERASVIRRCTAEANNSSDTAVTGDAGIAVGILLSGTCVNCIVDGNMISNNQNLFDGGTPAGSIRSIGYWDQATDSTTYLTRNTSTGQGTVYAGKTVLVDPVADTASVNYYMTYTEDPKDFNPENIIKETDISNLNAIAVSGGESLFNWSIVTNSQA